jgi:hypothetical protein
MDNFCDFAGHCEFGLHCAGWVHNKYNRKKKFKKAPSGTIVDWRISSE